MGPEAPRSQAGLLLYLCGPSRHAAAGGAVREPVAGAALRARPWESGRSGSSGLSNSPPPLLGTEWACPPFLGIFPSSLFEPRVKQGCVQDRMRFSDWKWGAGGRPWAEGRTVGVARRLMSLTDRWRVGRLQSLE